MLIKKTLIVVQFKDIAMAETLDVFHDVCDLLQVLVLTIAKYWIVHNDAIYAIIFIGCYDIRFEVFPIDLSKFKFEAAEYSMSEFN